MAKLLTLLFCLISLPLTAASVIDGSNLYFRNGIYYQKNQSQPFTGIAQTYQTKANVKYKSSEAQYNQGKKETETTYHPNGKIKYQETYLNGRINGVFIEWHDNGQKAREIEFNNGDIVSTVSTWYKNGQLQRQKPYQNNKKNGVEIWWYSNGTKQAEINYKDGVFDGLFSQWYENGIKASEYFFENGKPNNGIFTKWFANGQKMMEIEFVSGRNMKQKCWAKDGKERLWFMCNL